jgi:SAM-dependent methyltransferase
MSQRHAPYEVYRLVRSSLRALAPGLAQKYRLMKYHLLRRLPDLNSGRSLEQIFSEIYARNAWGGKKGDFYSGKGSEDNELFARIVNQLVDSHGIRSIVDLGCGDFRIGKQIARSSIKYIGVDIVAALVERNQSAFACENISFKQCDAVTDGLPAADLCIIRQVLQHLANDQISRILQKLSVFRHAIVAEHHPAPSKLRKANLDKPAGADTRIWFGSGVFPDRPPFSLPKVRILAQTPVPPIVDPGEH